MQASIPDVPVLIAILAFLVISMFLFGVLHYFLQRSKTSECVNKIRESGEPLKEVKEEDQASKKESLIKTKVFSFLNSLGSRALSENADDIPADYRQMRLRFLKAGIWQTNAPTIFWGAKIFLVVFLPICFLIVRITAFEIFNDVASLGGAVSLALLGFYMPDIWLRVKTDRRKERILEGMPDALDLLVVCVEAGMGLDAAISRVAEEIKLSNVTLSDEFKHMTLELRAGKARQDALKNLGLRTDLEDVNSFVTLLIQTDKFGTSVSKALKVYSDSFRTKRYQKAEEIAAKLPIKLVFPCILFIFPALFVAIMGPAVIRIYQTFLQ
jgi:tight adherence protein C